jgi:uroporphyrinogen decarboxylase
MGGENRALSLFGGDQTHRLMIPVLNPDGVRRAMRYAVEYNRRLAAECAKREISIVTCGRDYGGTTGCIESPQVIRDLYLPLHRQTNETIVAAGQTPFLHCCGRVWDILEDLVGVGYRGYQSIQSSAGMDWLEIKKRYGDQITLWTGVQCKTLVEGTAEDVTREVTQALDDLMPGGGFVFGSTNSVQFGASTDHYLRALDIVREKGVY